MNTTNPKVQFNIQEQKELWSNVQIWSDSKDGHIWSDYFGTTDNLWHTILPKFQRYVKGEVLEIAPGYGRITEYLLRMTDCLHIVDLNRVCIETCQKKFGDRIKAYIVNEGFNLDFPDDYFSFVFSYDSFVHMTADVVEGYLSEIARTLKRGGYGFIHHAYFHGGTDSCKDNKAGRQNMQPVLFRRLAEKYGLEIVSQEDFRCSNDALDTISIFRKP